MLPVTIWAERSTVAIRIWRLVGAGRSINLACNLGRFTGFAGEAPSRPASAGDWTGKGGVVRATIFFAAAERP